MTIEELLHHLLVPRPDGSESLSRVASFIEATLSRHAPEVTLQPFTAALHALQLVLSAGFALMLGFAATLLVVSGTRGRADPPLHGSLRDAFTSVRTGTMGETSRPERSLRCVFCRMGISYRFVGLPMYPICRDQSYDFLWASVVQALVAVVGGLSTLFFVVEEVLLFTVLVLVKHRIRPPWERAQ